MQTVSHSQGRKREGLHHLVQSYLPAFSISMLGLVAIRIWIQCCLYDRYVSTDSGIVTIVSNLFRVVVIILFIVVAVRRGFSPKAQTILGYASIFAMMLAAVLFLAFAQLGTSFLLWVACLCAGFGIVWGGGMWICAFVRMHPGEAFLYVFLSLAISSFFGFFLGLLPITVSYLVAILMPPIALVSYQKAQQVLNTREQDFTSTPPGGIRDTGPDAVYEKEPRTTFVRLTAGIALFNLALGIARGFPFGESIALPLAFQAMHQFGTVLLCLVLLWWALAKERSLRFSSLWNISVACIAFGVLLLATLDSAFEPFGATLISVANTFSIGLLWFSIYDLSRHSKVPAYLIVSAVWAIHILPRELGRFAIWAAEPHEVTAIVLTAVIVFFLAGSMAFLLNDSIPKTRPFFAEFRKDKSPRTLKDRVIAVADAQKSDGAPTADVSADGAFAAGASAADTPSASTSTADASSAGASTDSVLFAGAESPLDPPTSDPFELALESVQTTYFLTDREIEVIRLMAQGRSKIYIGKKLYISENTVKTYVKNIYTKLSIHSKEELLDCLEKAQTKSTKK